MHVVSPPPFLGKTAEKHFLNFLQVTSITLHKDSKLFPAIPGKIWSGTLPLIHCIECIIFFILLYCKMKKKILPGMFYGDIIGTNKLLQ